MGSSGKNASTLTDFASLAEEYGFIVAYPNADLGVWRPVNDEVSTNLPDMGLFKVDDVAFIHDLIDALSAEYAIDPNRVYLTGSSNGGMLAQWIAMTAPDRFAAVATVAATIPTYYFDAQPSDQPIPMLMMHGTDDPTVPFDGGEFRLIPDVSSQPIADMGLPSVAFLSAAETVGYWMDRNQPDNTPIVIEHEDLDPTDGATATAFFYGGNTPVVFYRIDGGGHTWPRQDDVGRTTFTGTMCRDFRAAEVIWDFFSAHQRTDRET
jgi:polyhydroxybutyrate depolymerase